MAQIPHYTQIGHSPAIVGAGSGLFNCECGQSLIADYEPRNFLGIAVQCAACGRISETPGLPDGAQPPANVTLVERGPENPPRTVTNDTVLISREEMERLVAFHQPRATGADPHVVSDALLDEVEIQQRNWTNEALDPSPHGYKSHPLAWAVAHFRQRLRDPEWTSFADSSDSTAVAVIAAFRDLCASWAHHPLFGAMIGTAAAQGYSLHAMAQFGAAKSLTSAGNQIAFVPTAGPNPRIASFQLLLGPQEQMSVVVNRFDRFEWPDGVEATPQAIRAAAIEAMASVQGSINRLRPGMLVLSPGAVEGKADQLFIDNIFAAIGSHGKRYRGLAAVAVIAPKVLPTGKPREVRFGYSFYPIPNRNHAIGQSVRIGSRADHTGVRRS
ncbi:MAG: hypothetical protein ABSE20_18400 [Acetobacteraceae bacterium]